MVGFEKAYCEYRLNRVESALKTIEAASEQTDKLKELYGQVVRILALGLQGWRYVYKPNVIAQQVLNSESLGFIQTR